MPDAPDALSLGGRLSRLLLLFLAHAVGTANITIVLAASPAIETAMDLGHATFGLVVSSYYGAVLALSIPAGYVADRLGIPGANFDHPVMAAALDRLVKTAKARGKYVMTSVGARIDTAYARQIFARGVRLISYSADALVFLEACRQIAATRA